MNNSIIYLYEVLPKEIVNNTTETTVEKEPIYLNIGTSGNYSSLFVDILNILSSKYTNVLPNMVSRESNDLLFDLDKKDYDMIFCNTTQSFIDSFKTNSKKYTLYPIVQSEIYIFANKFSPLAAKEYVMLEELESLPISFVRSNHDVTPLFLEILQQKNINPTISFTATSPQCCSDYFYKTNTYILGSVFMKKSNQKRGIDVKAIPIKGIEPIWQVFLVRKDIETPQLADDMLSLITKIF